MNAESSQKLKQAKALLSMPPQEVDLDAVFNILVDVPEEDLNEFLATDEKFVLQ